MGLPLIQIPRDIFKFSNGETLEYRGLSRAEAIQLRNLGEDVDAIEAFTIAKACGTTVEEAEAWHEATPNEDVRGLVDAIYALSGLTPDVGKDDAEGSLSASLTESTT